MEKIKQFIKKYLAIIIAVGAFVIGAISYFIFKKAAVVVKPAQLPAPIQVAKEKLQSDLSKERIDAAVTIAEARGEENAVIEEIEHTVKESDKAKQLQKLADLANRTRRY